MRTRRTWARLVAVLAVALVAVVGLAPRAAWAAGDSVASIGEAEYPTLAAAVAKVPVNGAETTIVLTDDIEMTTSDIVTIREGQNVRLELADHAITVSASDFSGRPIKNYGELTVIGGNGRIDSSAAGADGFGSIENFGTLTVESGTFRGSLDSNAANMWNRAGGTMTINGGTFDTNCTAVRTAEGSTTTITGGSFTSPWYAAVQNDGNMTISGGTFKNTSCSTCDSDHWAYTISSGGDSDSAYLKIEYATVTGTQGGVSVVGGTADIYDGEFKTVECPKKHDAVFYALYVAGEAYETSATVYGGTFSSERREAVHVGNNNAGGDGGNRKGATLDIKGGNFTGRGTNQTAVVVDNVLGGASISGGKFSSDVSDFLADDFTLVWNGGNYNVVELPDVAEVNGDKYKSFAKAVEAAQPGQTVTLLANASTDPLTIDKGITLDLGGHTLSLTGPGDEDEVGLLLTSGSSTIKNGTIYDGRGAVRTFSIIVNGRDTALTTQDLTLTVLVPEDSADNYPLRAQNGAALTLNSGTTINEDNDNGTRQGYTYGVTVYGNSTEHAVDPATATTLVVNDGVTVSSGAFAVSGNARGSYENTVMTINGGTLESTMGAAIYHPHYGRLVVNGGVIQGLAGIEMRAGELEIAGGLIKGGDGDFTYVPNGGGSTSDNVALAVMQHTTKLPIKIDISGGTFEATEAFAQMNVQKNEQEAVRRIDLSIAGGEFKGGIYSENFKDVDGKGFVSGGSFSDRAVGDFLAHDAAVAVNDGETPYDIFPSADEALENGGAHKVVDKNGVVWVFADKDEAEDFATANGVKVETITHAVTFDDCLPSTTNQVVEVENGSPVTKPTDPVCEGWKFLGWYEFANGSYAAEPYDFAAPVRSDLTLYAKWEQIEEEPEVTPQNPSESEKDDGLAQTGDVTSFLPVIVAGAAGLTAAAGALTLRRRSK